MMPYFSYDTFHIGIFQFYVWGSFLSLAFFVSLIFAFAYGRKNAWPAIRTVNLLLSVYIGALIGARVFYFLQPGMISSWRLFFDLSERGMTFYGGLFGGLLAGWLYLRKQGNWPKILDDFAPIAALSLAIGRIGCFLINDHQGAETNLVWAIQWPDGTLRHPVALYLIIFDLALAGFLWWRAAGFPPFCKGRLGGICRKANPPRPFSYQVRDRLFEKEGSQFALFLFLYSLGRFLLDFLREATVDPHYLGLASSQWISLLLLGFIFVYGILIRKKALFL